MINEQKIQALELEIWKPEQCVTPHQDFAVINTNYLFIYTGTTQPLLSVAYLWTVNQEITTLLSVE